MGAAEAKAAAATAAAGTANRGAEVAAPKAKRNTLLEVLGDPTFLKGDGKVYPRTTGWGANKKPHPEGGTNQTVAFIVFKPWAKYGLELSQEGRIYMEAFDEIGSNGVKVAKRRYSISLTFLKPEKRDGDSNAMIAALKIELRDLYRKWSADPEVAKASKATASADTGGWDEDPAPTEPAK